MPRRAPSSFTLEQYRWRYSGRKTIRNASGRRRHNIQRNRPSSAPQQRRGQRPKSPGHHPPRGQEGGLLPKQLRGGSGQLDSLMVRGGAAAQRPDRVQRRGDPFEVDRWAQPSRAYAPPPAKKRAPKPRPRAFH